MTKEIKPLMRKGEINSIKKELLRLGQLGKKINILEWGSGGSTVYFSKFLDDNEIDYEWFSIEYNKNWYEEILNKLKDNSKIKIVLFDVGNNNIRQRNVDMTKYVKHPSTLNKIFDFILVDGRKRRLCILEAQKIVSSDGVVFLHDAQRTYYHCAIKNYSDSFFVGPFLWRGSNRKVNLSKKICSKIVYWFWRPVNFVRFKIIKVLRFFYHKIKNENI